MPVPLLEIRDLRVEYTPGRGLLRRPAPVRVLDGIDLIANERETLGLVGESGSGKTTLLLSVLRLIPAAGGEVRIGGEDFLTAPRDRLRSLRRQIQVVFQNPHSSLDPHFPVQELVAEPLRIHTQMTRPERIGRVARLLDDVGLPSSLAKAFAHELSGGEAQRVAIARALALNPTLLLLDEPTSSLDVSVQAQVLNLLVDLQREHGLTYVFVSHDLSVVQHISDRIAVLYLGEIVEVGPTERIFETPLHPYTRALLTASLPAEASDKAVLLPGSVPSFLTPPSGCRLHPRCPFAMGVCPVVHPDPTYVDEGHWAACHLLSAAHKGEELPIAITSRGGPL